MVWCCYVAKPSWYILGCGCVWRQALAWFVCAVDAQFCASLTVKMTTTRANHQAGIFHNVEITEIGLESCIAVRLNLVTLIAQEMAVA
jgi:hypothetical protein